MNIDRAAIYTPQPNEILVVQGTLDSRTVQWAVNVEQLRWSPGAVPLNFALAGRILGATFHDGTDDRLRNQRRSIDDLLGHVKHHCPRFAEPPHACDYKADPVGR